MANCQELFERLQAAADAEFRRNRRLHRGRIHCGDGCTDCCRQLFHITEVEAARISKALAAAPKDLRDRLRQRARDYLPKREALLRREGFLDGRGALAPPAQRLDCPALEDGRCAVYDDRPLLCRRIGAPLLYPDQPGRLYACERNFRTGETVSDPRLLTIQTILASDRAAMEQVFDRSGGRRYREPITVAHAILEDFQNLTPPATA